MSDTQLRDTEQYDAEPSRTQPHGTEQLDTALSRIEPRATEPRPGESRATEHGGTEHTTHPGTGPSGTEHGGTEHTTHPGTGPSGTAHPGTGRLLAGLAWVVLLLGLWQWGADRPDVRQGPARPTTGDMAAVGRPAPDRPSGDPSVPHLTRRP